MFLKQSQQLERATAPQVMGHWGFKEATGEKKADGKKILVFSKL